MMLVNVTFLFVGYLFGIFTMGMIAAGRDE